jgi:hypothetical protein
MFARKHYDKDYLYLTTPIQFLPLKYKEEEWRRGGVEERWGWEGEGGRQKSSFKNAYVSFSTQRTMPDLTPLTRPFKCT